MKQIVLLTCFLIPTGWHDQSVVIVRLRSIGQVVLLKNYSYLSETCAKKQNTLMKQFVLKLIMVFDFQKNVRLWGGGGSLILVRRFTGRVS